ncbi:hypothetical protein DL96DRAFT_1694504 [Flagelloscypha sp. PMI_526]|nr:hypothetical protein DL96DRAFT_1694504 [Flagelloscypha sp. PMI_526]
MASTPPPFRVVVRVPWERPEDAHDPPPIEWNSDKADILWKTIEKSRASDHQAMDWKALAMRLDVPLPYLLYRAHARFQEELRGIQNIQGALSPTFQSPESPLASPLSSRFVSNGASTLRGPSATLTPRAQATPLGVRARLTSLGHNSQRPKKTASSSTLTLQGPSLRAPRRLPSESPPESSDDEDLEDEVLKEEAAEREAEEAELLDRKLKDLQALVKNDGLGLVSRPRTSSTAQSPSSSQNFDRRGRPVSSAVTSSQPSLRREMVQHRSVSHSLSNTSASSPQGSIPDIPSPPSLIASPTKSGSPPALSPRSPLGRRHQRGGSNHGSETSSFSDISDASLSVSALESALMSNIRGHGSRFSTLTRSRLPGTRSGSGVYH